MSALRRLLPSAATGRFLPVGEEHPARIAQPLTDVAPHDIERSVKRGAVWALGAQIGTQVLRLVGVAVLARLLTPDDYGAAALAITLGSFSMILLGTGPRSSKPRRRRSAGRRLRGGVRSRRGRWDRDALRLAPTRLLSRSTILRSPVS